MDTRIVSVFVGLTYLIQSHSSCCGTPVVPHGMLMWLILESFNEVNFGFIKT